MKNSKKAFVDKILLGFFLFVLIIGFFGIISDQLMVKNKILALRKVAQTASLSAAKYYVNEEQNTTKAEEVANKIVNSIPLGNEIVDSLVYTWKKPLGSPIPTSVDVNITSYTQPMFWSRLLRWDEKVIKNISSKANIVVKPIENIEEADDFVPIAVNGCGKTYNIGTTYTKLYKTNDTYDVNDSIAFYSLIFDFTNPMKNFMDMMQDMAQNHRNRLKKENNFIFHNEFQFKFAPFLNTQITNIIPSMANSFRVLENKNVNIAVLDCGSTKDNLIIKEILPIHIEPDTKCTKMCCKIDFFGHFSFGSCIWPFTMMCNMMKVFENFSEDMLGNSMWHVNSDETSCSDANMFSFSFKVRSKEKVLLKY